jgi:elongation factor G
MTFPEPLISIAIAPRTKADQEKLTQGLFRLVAEDPALRVKSGEAAGDVVIGGVSDLHLEIVIDRLKREFGVEAGVGRPQIAYKETLTRSADGEMKYASQAGGRGQYAHVKIHVVPGDPGSGYIFENEVIQGAIPKQFIRAIREGIGEALTRGVVAGYPLDGIRVQLYDGSYHDVDSSEAAFRTAAAMAFEDAAKKAGPVLLEPVMRVEVVVPEEYAGDVMENLSSRRGVVQSREDRDGTQIVGARVPLAEMFGYATDLRSRSMGRGTYSMHFDRYQPCPPARGDEGGLASLVRAPRKPGPFRDGRVALPEPDDDGWKAR